MPKSLKRKWRNSEEQDDSDLDADDSKSDDSQDDLGSDAGEDGFDFDVACSVSPLAKICLGKNCTSSSSYTDVRAYRYASIPSFSVNC